MPEQLQHLLQRIRTEAIETSESQAEEILSGARHQAATIVNAAEAEAKRLLRDAELESQVYADRSTQALEQAGRDLLITVGQGIQSTIEQIVGTAVDDAFDPTFLQEQIGKVITAWLSHSDDTGMEVRVHPADEASIRSFVQAKFQAALAAGLVVRGDSGILKGFRISYNGSNAFHDFTTPTIADALSELIRPQLSEIIHRVARDATRPRNASP